MKLYQDLLMDHFKNPRHHGTLEKAAFTSGQMNPSCGDDISVCGNIKDNVLVEARFEGKGCVISQAAASLLLEHTLGKQIDEILKMGPQDMLALLNVKLGPMRMHCAMLSLIALQKGIESYQKKTKKK